MTSPEQLTLLKFFHGSLVGSIAFSVSTAIVSYVLLMLITRLYSEQQVAHYLYVIAWALVLHLCIDFAFEQCGVHYAKNTGAPIWTIWRFMCGIKFALVAALVTLGTLWEMTTNHDFPQSLLLLMVPVFYLGPVYEMLDKNRLYAGIIFFEKGALLLLAAVAGLFSSEIDFVLVAYFICSCFSFIAQIWLVRDKRDTLNSTIKISFVDYFSRYHSIYIVLLAQIFYGHVSRLIVEGKAGSSAFVAMSLALQLVNSISMVQSQVDRHVRPRLVHAVYDRSLERIKTILFQYGFFYVFPLVLGCIFLSWQADLVVSLIYGEGWSTVGPVLAQASPLILSIALMRLIDTFVVSMGVGRANLKVNVLVASALFLTMFIMPAHGLDFYIRTILLFQAFHVVLMTIIIWLRSRSLFIA